MYAENDRVRFTYNAYSLTTDEFIGTVDVTATITRVWSNGKYVSLRTDDGALYVRCVNSPSISPTVKQEFQLTDYEVERIWDRLPPIPD